MIYFGGVPSPLRAWKCPADLCLFWGASDRTPGGPHFEQDSSNAFAVHDSRLCFRRSKFSLRHCENLSKSACSFSSVFVGVWLVEHDRLDCMGGLDCMRLMEPPGFCSQGAHLGRAHEGHQNHAEEIKTQQQRTVILKTTNQPTKEGGR